MTVSNQNLIQKEIKRRLNSSNASYNSFHNFLSSRLLPKNVKINIQNYNFAYGSVQVWNLVSDIKGGT
jgi:hypothetical protein